MRSPQAHSGLWCPELAQLRPQIVPWSTLCRADWVRNGSSPRSGLPPGASPAVFVEMLLKGFEHVLVLPRL